MKRKIQALAVLILLGIGKIPLEEGFTRRLREERLLNPPLKVEVKERLTQMGAAASLGGLRSLVASVYYLRAIIEWERVNWGKVESIFWVVTRLQPRYANYWDEAAWHMAFNAASSYLYDESLTPRLRGSLYDDYVARGLRILKEGLEYNPDDARLWNALAELYEQRLHDYPKAAECYLQVYRVSNNARYFRFAAYQYTRTQDPALWQKAYEMLREAYTKGQRPPSVIETLKALEQRLNIPFPRRIPDKLPDLPVRPPEVGPQPQ